MQIRPLNRTPLPEIVACLLEAFEGYFVPMPTEVSYWENRFRGAAVNYGLSFGAFDRDKLVAFIMIGVDEFAGKLTAFNTGTGVIPAFRGQGLVDQLYAVALPAFRGQGIDYSMLEVITENARAIRVYERIGFQILRQVRCLKGEVTLPAPKHSVETIPVDHPLIQADPSPYSWDHTLPAMRRSGKVFTHQLFRNEAGAPIGYASMKPNGYIARFFAESAHQETLLACLGAHYPKLSINNVDIQLQDRLTALIRTGLQAKVDQYEMGMPK